MKNLQYRQQKIQTKRKQTTWKEFVRDVCSWFPLVLNREHGEVSRYPKTNRIWWISSSWWSEDPVEVVYDGDFYWSFSAVMSQSYFSPLLHWWKNEQVGYADIVLNAKYAYLSNAVVGDSENVLYSWSVKHNCTDVVSSVMVRNGSSRVFESSGIIQSSNIFYSQTIQNSSDIWFCKDLINCHHCILSSNLENQSYCIRNKQYTKEEYVSKKNKLLHDKYTFELLQHESWTTESHDWSPAYVGHGIFSCVDVSNWYFANDVVHGNNLILFWSNTDCEYIYDCITWGSPHGTHLYWGLSLSGEHIYCGAHCEDCFNVYYSFDIEGCSYCLGCVGIKNKSYCILNKQYTKEERYQKVDEIFSTMEKEGILGDCFPWSMSPFYFNDTAAYLIDDSFTKEEVAAEWYLWRDKEVRVDIPEGVDVVKVSELGGYEGRKDSPHPSGAPLTEGSTASWWIDPEILNKVIQDEQGNIYRIVKMEYDFLIKHELPLPRLHWLDRLKHNFKM